MNQVRNNQDIHMGLNIKSAFKKYLDLEASYIGYVENRTEIATSVTAGRPFMITYSKSSGAQEIQTCLSNLMQGKEAKLPKI